MNTYQDKNLIYVGGKGYKEQDLIDMITYYHENYKPNIVFPQGWHEDVNEQIFKHYPFYSTISKNTQPNLYYEQNCNLDITFKEFLNYISEEQPNEVQLMTKNHYNDIGDVINIVKITKNNDKYMYANTYINKLDGIVQDDHEYNIDKTILLLINQHRRFEYILYDFITAENIYKRRKQCVTYDKKYIANMVVNNINGILSLVPKTIDINNYNVYYSIYLFLLRMAKNTKHIEDNFVNVLDDSINDGGISDNLLEYKIVVGDEQFELTGPDNTVIFSNIK